MTEETSPDMAKELLLKVMEPLVFMDIIDFEGDDQGSFDPFTDPAPTASSSNRYLFMLKKLVASAHSALSKLKNIRLQNLWPQQQQAVKELDKLLKDMENFADAYINFFTATDRLASQIDFDTQGRVGVPRSASRQVRKWQMKGRRAALRLDRQIGKVDRVLTGSFFESILPYEEIEKWKAAMEQPLLERLDKEYPA